MLLRVPTIQELKQIWVNNFLNKTPNVTKVSDNSVLGGIAYGISKVAQKSLNEVSIVLSKLFPDTAFGTQLDEITELWGVPSRFGASPSTTYVRLVGEPGTVYSRTTHLLNSTEGVQFQFEDTTITIPAIGYILVKVRSTTSGSNTNIPPLTITSLSSNPVGHLYVVNDFEATGGADVEPDLLLRRRIKLGSNLSSLGTIAKIEQVFMKINNNVLRVIYRGFDGQGRIRLGVVTQNGASLSFEEIEALTSESLEFLSLVELRPYRERSPRIVVENIEFQPIDIDYRLSYSGDISIIRRETQAQMSKSLDYRFWRSGRKVEWDDLLSIAKNIKGVEYIPDNYFQPGADIVVDPEKLPRIRSFVLRNLTGSVIEDVTGVLNPVFFPASPSLPLQETLFPNV